MKLKMLVLKAVKDVKVWIGNIKLCGIDATALDDRGQAGLKQAAVGYRMLEESLKEGEKL